MDNIKQIIEDEIIKTKVVKKEELQSLSEEIKNEIIERFIPIKRDFRIYCKVVILDKRNKDDILLWHSKLINEEKDFLIKGTVDINEERENKYCVIYNVFFISS